jgi:hypothetical protein
MVKANIGISDRLMPDHRVKEGEVSLKSARGTGSVRATLDKEACRHAGIDPLEPGSVSWYYLRSEGLLVFDLAGEFDEEGGDE